MNTLTYTFTALNRNTKKQSLITDKVKANSREQAMKIFYLLHPFTQILAGNIIK